MKHHTITIFFLWVVIAWGQTQAQTHRVVEGQMDLRQVAWTNQWVVPVIGDWKYANQRLLSPRQMQSDSAAAYFMAVPGEWNKFTWQGQPIAGHNFATYQVTLLLPPNLPDFAIHFPSQGTSYRLFVNGKLVKEVGKVGTTAQTSAPYYENFLYLMSEVPDTLVLTVQIANFNYRKGGMWHEPIVGRIPALLRWKEVTTSTDVFVLGAILFMAIYQLALYLFRPIYKASLYFVIVCLCAIAREASLGELLWLKIFPQMPWETLIQLEFISLFVGFLFSVRLMHFFYPNESNLSIIRLLDLLTLVFVLVSLIFPPRISSYIVLVFEAAFFLYFVYTFWVMGQAIRNQRTGAYFFTGGMLFLLIAGVHDIFYYNYWVSTGALMTLGLFVYFLTQLVIMAQHFAKIFKDNEKLSAELIATNANLEQMVDERTVELNETIEELNISNQEIHRTFHLVNHQKKHLEELHHEKDGLMGVVVHDLRTPFNRLLGIIDLFETNNLTQGQKNYFELIKKTCEQGLNLIRDLLVLNNAEYEKNDLSLETVEVPTFVERVAAEFHALAQTKDIRIHLTNPAGEFVAQTHPEYLRRILENLLSNAIKFSYPNKSVFVGIEQSPCYQSWTLTIRDEGQGIAPDEMPKLFRKFQKLSARPTAGEDSTGLGLAIVKMLVEKLQGHIIVHSDEQRSGTSFQVQFPAIRPNHQTSAGAS